MVRYRFGTDDLLRTRFAAKCEIELEEHTSSIVFGDAEGIPNRDYGRPAVEVLEILAPIPGEPGASATG